MKVIKSEGLADGRDKFNGQYLVSYDPEALGGMGSFVWSPNVEDAKRFRDAAEAWVLWKTVPKSRKLRPDGKPNRPLTAFTIAIEDAPEASGGGI
jgi:hypothetical protein